MPLRRVSPLPLPPHVFHVLLALRHGPMHGYAIKKAVRERSDGQIDLDPGGLYRLIDRLEADGVLEATRPPDGAPEDERTRIYYRLTASGTRLVAAEARRLAALVSSAGREDIAAGGAGMIIERVYRALLRILPRHFRERFGAEMAQMFSDEWLESNRPARIRLAFRAVLGLFWTAIVVRVRPGYRGPRAETPPRECLVGHRHGRACNHALAAHAAGLYGDRCARAGTGDWRDHGRVLGGAVHGAACAAIPEVDRAVALWSEFDA